MTTCNAAEFPELMDYGQVKAGYVASLVILDENPLTAIKNTGTIRTVIRKGKVSDKATLAVMKK